MWGGKGDKASISPCARRGETLRLGRSSGARGYREAIRRAPRHHLLPSLSRSLTVEEGRHAVLLSRTSVWRARPAVARSNDRAPVAQGDASHSTRAASPTLTNGRGVNSFGLAPHTTRASPSWELALARPGGAADAIRSAPRFSPVQPSAASDRAANHRAKDASPSVEGRPKNRPSTLKSSSRSGQWIP